MDRGTNLWAVEVDALCHELEAACKDAVDPDKALFWKARRLLREAKRHMKQLLMALEARDAD